MGKPASEVVGAEPHDKTAEIVITYDMCCVCRTFATHTLSLGDDMVFDFCYPHLRERLDLLLSQWWEIDNLGWSNRK